MGRGLNSGRVLPRSGSLERRQGPDPPALGAEGGNKGVRHLATGSVQVTPVSGGQTPPPADGQRVIASQGHATELTS